MIEKLIDVVKDSLIEAVGTKLSVNEKNRKYAFWVVIISGIALILGVVYLSKKSKSGGSDKEILEE